MKRTKRYGGFRIGDRVQRKDGLFKFLVAGEVVKLHLGYVSTKWFDLNGKEFTAKFMPNQLINLTRIEEDFDKFLNEGEIEIPLTEEDAKDIIAKKQQEYVKHFARKHFGDPLPSPYTRDVYTTTKDYFVS